MFIVHPASLIPRATIFNTSKTFSKSPVDHPDKRTLLFSAQEESRYLSDGILFGAHYKAQMTLICNGKVVSWNGKFSFST